MQTFGEKRFWITSQEISVPFANWARLAGRFLSYGNAKSDLPSFKKESVIFLRDKKYDETIITGGLLHLRTN